MATKIKITLNGEDKAFLSDPRRSLLDVLREDFGLTGAKYACGEGQCGACSVLVDGHSTRSCVTQIGTVHNKAVVTIEGLSKSEALHPVQQAFIEEGAVQCGYCTGGMIVSTVALLRSKGNPTDREIIRGLDGHICRCNGYPKIVNAVRRASDAMKE